MSEYALVSFDSPYLLPRTYRRRNGREEAKSIAEGRAARAKSPLGKTKRKKRERRLPKNGDDYEAISEYANADFYIENVNKFQKILIIDSAIFLNVRIKD